MKNSKVIIKESKQPGNTVLILAGVHGNETPNVHAFDEILPQIQITKGKAIFIYANLQAITEK